MLSLQPQAAGALVGLAAAAALALGAGSAAAESNVRLPPLSTDPQRCERAYTGNTIGQANAVSDKILDLRFCDFTGKDLTAKTLSGALLAGTNLSNANLSEVVMSKAYAVDTNFAGVNLTNAVIDRVALDKSDMTGAKFVNAVITGCTFEGTNLANTVFEDALIGSEDAKRLCLNPTLTGESRSQGVGSHAAHLLLRSGVGRLRLVDFDQVSLSSLNRHCLATRRDVGVPKAACLARHFKEIMPEADVEALCAMYNDETEEHVLGGRPDFVLDAIDNIDTKVALLAACRRRGLPVLCVAGAGAKADPTRLRFVDVAESSVDPLARAVRQRLRRDHGIEAGVTVLLSTERPRCGLIFGGEEGSNPLDYQVVPNFRIRTIPVLGTTPAVFGLAAAGHILCELAGAPFTPAPVFRLQAKAVQTQYNRLEERERERRHRAAASTAHGVGAWEGPRAESRCGGGDSDRGGAAYEGTADEGTAAGDVGDVLGVDAQEVEVLLRELWRGTSARAARPPTSDRALSRQIGQLALTRWDPARPATVDNLVLLTREEADAHDAEVEAPGGLQALQQREPQLCAGVEAVLQRARREFQHAYFLTS